MNESKYEVILHWDKADEIFVAQVPELPGCMAHGETRAEVIRNVEEAVELWVETAREDGIVIPEPREHLFFIDR